MSVLNLSYNYVENIANAVSICIGIVFLLTLKSTLRCATISQEVNSFSFERADHTVLLLFQSTSAD